MNKLDNLHTALTFDDVLIVPSYSYIQSRSVINTDWELGKYKFTTPIISANMDTITGYDMVAKMALLGGLGILHRYMSVEEYIRLSNKWDYSTEAAMEKPFALSVGTLMKDSFRIDTIINDKLCDVICVDIAHGDSIMMHDTIKYIRDKGFKGPIIAGNVVTPEAVRFLTEAGADVVKVGVGPGSVCTTRVKTGCGYPQLEAIARCSEAGEVIADGGIKTPGDAAKAFAAGASAIMIGGMLAGTDKVPGWFDPTIDKHSRVTYRGMASNEARKDFNQEESNAEGVSKQVLCRPPGSTQKVIEDIMEGVRSSMSYVGASNLDEFRKKARFVRVTGSTQIENNPHFKG